MNGRVRVHRSVTDLECRIEDLAAELHDAEEETPLFPETSLVVALTTMVSPTKLMESGAPDPTVTAMPPATGLVLAFSVTVFRTMKQFA